MEYREYFKQEFNKIIKDTEKDYLPLEEDVKDLHDLFDGIIKSWDVDMRDHGIKGQISYYKKSAKKFDKALTMLKENLDPGIVLKRDKKGKPLPPDNNPQSVRISKGFFLSAVLKTDRFIIEYLEGLKKKKAEQPKENKDPSYKVIAIVWFVIGVKGITSLDATKILAKYSGKKKSTKELLEARITSMKDLTLASDDKAAATKHFNSLLDAKRILNGAKDKEAVKSIDKIIATYTIDYNKKHPGDTK
jgi:hypothetical protein